MKLNLCIAFGFLVSASLGDPQSLLVSGVATNNLELVKSALNDGAEINKKDAQKQTAVMKASLEGRHEIVGE